MSKRFKWVLVLLLLGLGLWWLWEHRFGTPEDYGHMEDQYKYGSIGADHPLALAPLPYWIWKVLPTVFPTDSTIPEGQRGAGDEPSQLGPRNGQPGLAAFGLITEPTMPQTMPPRPEGAPSFERPIGFSKRRVFGFDLLGMNCSFCHLGTLRVTEKDKPVPILGGVGQNVDIEQYFMYVFSALQHKDFTAEKLMPAIDAELKRQGATLNFLERALYRWVLIPVLPSYAGAMEKKKFDFLIPDVLTRRREFGPGRVDTWALYKRLLVNDHRPAVGTVDFPPIWNQKARSTMRLHWDGNTEVLLERNVISALGLIGTRVQYLDFARLTRVTEWIEGLLPPRYADYLPNDWPPINRELADKGASLFQDFCARCHMPSGDRIGRVEPIEMLGTDRERMMAFTPELAAKLNTLGTDQWQLRNFRVQNGYVNNLLDGIWLRGPYLHNGTVPTLRDLLEPPEKRPKRFCRGSDVYDWAKLGFESALSADGRCPTSFLIDTDKKYPGHSNEGHAYGTTLPEADKRALLEFMKTL